MDQRAKGVAPPPPTQTPLSLSTPPEDSEKEGGGERRRRREGERGSTGRREEERGGAGRRGEGDGGAVLEVHIEGRCGGAGPRPLQFPGRESNCSEGNVKLRLGLQAKRTKKPPKILESYICKPTIRTYQRQGRGVAGAGDGEEGGGGGGGGSRSGKSTPSPRGGDGEQEQSQGADPQATRTPSSPRPPSSSSSSLPPSSSAAPATSSHTPASAGRAPAKQVPLKLANKTGVRSDVEPEKLPGCGSPPSPLCPASAEEPGRRGEAGPTGSPHLLNGTAQAERAGPGPASPAAAPRSAKSAKVRGRKQNCSSSPAPTDANAALRPPASSCRREHPGAQNATTERPRSPSKTSDPTPPPPGAQSSGQTAPGSTLGPPASPPHTPPAADKERGRRGKKERAKEKKQRHNKGKEETGASERGKEDSSKKKKREGKDDRGRGEMAREERWRDEAEMDGETSPGLLRGGGDGGEGAEPDSPRERDGAGDPPGAGGPEEAEPAEETGESAEPAQPGDGPPEPPGATVIPAEPPAASPSSPPGPLPACSPTSPPEQDSRPLKKRKARRPSWTKLVNRAQRLETQDAPLDAHLDAPLDAPLKPAAKASGHQTLEAHQAHPLSPPPNSSPVSAPLKPRPAGRPPSPTWTHLMTSDPDLPMAPKHPAAQAKKRGRPKSRTPSVDEPPPRHSPKSVRTEELLLGCEEAREPPGLDPALDLSPMSPAAANPNPSPRKRGRPKRLPPAPQDQTGAPPTPSEGKEGGEKRNRQLKIRRIIGEMKKRKRRRFPREVLSAYGGGTGSREGEEDGESSPGGPSGGRGGSTLVASLSSLSSSFGGKLGPQINVSKRGTIYMGKRRGRKPKAPPANPVPLSGLFGGGGGPPTGPSLFSSLPSHPFPSPSLTHSSGAQSPYSEGSLAEPASSSLLFPHAFSLPSPSSSCTSPHNPSSASSSLSPFAKRSCPCRGRHHFPFHHPSCRLASPPHHHAAAASPAHLKEATPSPVSESHSDETFPSDSGIGTDNNSISERERRGGRGGAGAGGGVTFRVTPEVTRSGLGLGGGQRGPPSALLDRPSPVPSPLSPLHRNPAALERHRDRERHRHRRRGYDCVSPCACLCPCPGHSKCAQLDYCPCVGQSPLKRQKSKHKRKQQQHLLAHDPDFLSELDELIGQLGEVHIGRRGWARAGPGGRGRDVGGNAAAGRRHHSNSSSSSSSSSQHHVRSNVYRINLNGYYSPHPSAYPPHPYPPHPTAYPPHHLYPCQSPHCSRKAERRQCGCPPKFQEAAAAADDLGFYRGYAPPTAASAALYPHPSFPLPPPHQYAPHHHHHHPPHLLLNPARFHRRRSRLLREGGEAAAAAAAEGGMGGGLSPCACGRAEHKHKHRKHRRRATEHGGGGGEEEEEEEQEEEGEAEPRSEFARGKVGEGGRRGGKGAEGVGSVEIPWRRRSGKDSPSASASAASAMASPSGERLKHTPLTCLGLGSSHLSSFGGSWLKRGGLGGTGFGHAPSPWSAFAGARHTGAAASAREREAESLPRTHLYSSSPPPTHTNLFTSAAMATGGGGRGPRTGAAGEKPGGGAGSQRREGSSWTERRGPGSMAAVWSGGRHSDSSREQKQSLAPGGAEGKRRGPGRPRKYPLPSPALSPAGLLPAPPDAPPPEPPEVQAGRGREGGVEEEGGRGGDGVEEAIESVVRARRKRGRKRRRAESPGLQSSGQGDPESNTTSVCIGHSEPIQAPPLTPTVQWDERVDGPPRKRFQRAGLYSDDYKTVDPDCQVQPVSRGTVEDSPGERDYSLLPAPIHVGKYLRLKRIDFQLPYDILWLWRHRQLHREPDAPLYRKRTLCRPKDSVVSPHHHHLTSEECSGGLRNLFPHLDMEPLTNSERCFVLKQHVFLVRNWQLVRDRQMQLRTDGGREREREGERDGHLYCDGGEGDGDGIYIKSGQPTGVKEVAVASDPRSKTQGTPTPLGARAHLSTGDEEEEDEEGKMEEEAYRREVQRERLDMILLRLRRA